MVGFKSLEGHFLGGIPVSCHLVWNQQGISHPQYVMMMICILSNCLFLAPVIFRLFWWFLWKKMWKTCDSCMGYIREQDLESRQSWPFQVLPQVLAPDAKGLGDGMDEIQVFFPIIVVPKEKRSPSKTTFFSFFQAVFELKHDCGRKDGWWLVHSKVFVWFLRFFLEKMFVWNPLGD